MTFTSISAGSGHSLAISADGNTYAWGDNQHGQLGDGTSSNRYAPVLVQAPAGVTFTSIDGGGIHSLAIGSDGNTYAWGDNRYGQLGDGTSSNRYAPVLVQTPVGVTFTSISAGYYYSLAIGSDGNTYAWGDNSKGQLGDGTTTNRNVPALVQAPAGVTFTSVSAGYESSLALGSDGNTYAWGNNGSGLLGDGTTTNRNVPVLVQAPAGVTFTSVTTGLSASGAIGSDGNTYAWGPGSRGQLGNGTYNSSNVPVQVQAPAGVTFISLGAGSSHFVAIGSDGNTYAWGWNGNSYGQLGDGGVNLNSNVPILVLVPAGVNFTSISAGPNQALALGSDGNTYPDSKRKRNTS
ncbi:MAG: hypothetical protein LCH36_11140 [Actinobacteria bacterium]|nr:hypothetical protein [Actinomycetota bacterium]